MKKLIRRTSDSAIINIVELPDSWTGAPGEWQPPAGHTAIDLAQGTFAPPATTPVAIDPVVKRVVGDQTINGTAFQDVAGLVFPVEANRNYAFEFYLPFRSAAATTGFGFGVNGPAGATVDVATQYQIVANAALGAPAFRHDTTFDAMAALTATIAANADLYVRMTGVLRVGATPGNFAARVRSELANNDLVVRDGGWGRVF